MARVTPEEVKKIIEVDENLDLLPFISIANILVNKCLGDSDLGSDLLKEIERWLSAHFISLRDRQPIRQSVSGLSADFGFDIGKGLSATVYGQQVKVLDITGKLSSLDNEKKYESKIETIKTDY